MQKYPAALYPCQTPCQRQRSLAHPCPRKLKSSRLLEKLQFCRRFWKLALSFTTVPSSSMSMMGWPPSRISSLFCGRNRQTTLMLLPDMPVATQKKWLTDKARGVVSCTWNSSRPQSRKKQDCWSFRSNDPESGCVWHEMQDTDFGYIYRAYRRNFNVGDR